nr:hypothetical protein [uncultured Limnohabitans sp.]
MALMSPVLLAQTQDVNDLPDAILLRKFRPPMVDRMRFEPLPPEQRMLNEPKVKLLVRKDGYEFCSRITGVPISPTSRPMACAYWNVKRKECTVITPEVTGYNYVGHEVRHCFEGAFHD